MMGTVPPNPPKPPSPLSEPITHSGLHTSYWMARGVNWERPPAVAVRYGLIDRHISLECFLGAVNYGLVTTMIPSHRAKMAICTQKACSATPLG